MYIKKEDHLKKIAHDGKERAYQVATGIARDVKAKNKQATPSDIRRELERSGFNKHETDRQIVNDVVQKESR